MRPYETMVVLSTSLGAEIEPLIERLHGVVTTRGGTIDASHDWGQRRLAYEIQKQGEGRYFLIEYSSEPDAVSELERSLRITDGVLRYLTVQQEHTGLPAPRERDLPRGDAPMHEMRSVGATPDSGGAARPAGQTAAPEQAQAPAETPSADATTESAPAAQEESAAKAEAGPPDATAAPDPAVAAASDDGVKSNE